MGIIKLITSRKIWIVSSLLFFLAGSMITVDLIIDKSNGEQDAIERAQSEIESGVRILNDKLEKAKALATGLANDISAGKLDSSQIIERLRFGAESSDDMFGLGVGYEAYLGSKYKELYAPFYIKPRNDHKLTFIDTSYDYRNSDWYAKPLNEGSNWYEPPYFGEVSQTMIAEYSSTFKLPHKKSNSGIIFSSISLAGLTSIVNHLSIGKSGYGFIISKTGNFIVHPIYDWVLTEKNISELADEIGSKDLQSFIDDKSKFDNEYFDLVDPLKGQVSHLMYEEIPSTGWKLGVIFVSSEFVEDFETSNKKRSISILLFAISLIFAIFIFYSYTSGSRKSKWLVSIAISLIANIAIGFIWLINLSVPNEVGKDNSYVVIKDQSVLNKFIMNQDSIYISQHKNMPDKIPTGLFIEHIEFTGKNTINLSGIVWQEIDTIKTDINKAGVSFPEVAPDAEAVVFEKAYEKWDGSKLVIGWNFRAAIRQKVNYGSYPFDRQVVSLRLWPKEMGGAILLPDLKSYSVINPAMLPGIEKDIVLRSWSPVSSFFDYEEIEYNTSFGIGNDYSNETKHELHYNVVLNRQFMGPFITNIIPLFVISILLFTIVMSVSNKEKDRKLGFSGFGVLEICAAFYFVVILAHIDLRNSLGVQQIIYLDYFYFLIYLKILVYAINSVLLIKFEGENFITKYNNLYPRLLYWPVYLCTLLIITFFVFY